MNTALYRRYRPDTFATVIGQDQVTRPLMVALDAGRINHAYLFSGPRGCGKTTCARIMARCLNCTQGPTANPCGRCPSCKELATGASGSLDVVEIDAASHNGVDDARELRERATFAPVRDRFKIFILDEAHMVTSQGFNALLKLVEEPPEHVKFIFATTEPEKVIATIRSRTHHYPFRLVAPDILRSFLAGLCSQENITVDEGVLELVIRAGGGSVRDSLSVLDQLMAGTKEGNLDYQSAVGLLGYTDSTLLQEVIDAIIGQDATALFKQLENVIESGLDPRRFLEDLLLRLRDLMLLGFSGAEIGNLSTLPQVQLEYMHKQVQRWNPTSIARAADLTASTITGMTGTVAPRLQIELLGAKLLTPSTGGINPTVGQNLLNGHSASGVTSNKEHSTSATVLAGMGADIEASMAAARAALAVSRTQMTAKQKLETAPDISERVSTQQVSAKQEEVSSEKSMLVVNKQAEAVNVTPQPGIVGKSKTELNTQSPVVPGVDTNPKTQAVKDVAQLETTKKTLETQVIEVLTAHQDRLRSKIPLWEYKVRQKWPHFLAAVKEKSHKLFCALNLVCEPRFDVPYRIEIATKDTSTQTLLDEQQRILVSVAKLIYPEWEIIIAEKYHPQIPIAIDFYQKLQAYKQDDGNKIDTDSWLEAMPTVDDLDSNKVANQSGQTKVVEGKDTVETTYSGGVKLVIPDGVVVDEGGKPSGNAVEEPSGVESQRVVAEESAVKNERVVASDWIIIEPDSDSGVVGNAQIATVATTRDYLENSRELEPKLHPEFTKVDNPKFTEEVPATDWDTGVESAVARTADTETVNATQETSKVDILQLGKLDIHNDDLKPVEKFLSEEDEISFDDEDAEPLITNVDQVLKQVLRAKKIEEINLQE